MGVGTGRLGEKYRYYVCANTKKHICGKKRIRKERLEDLVLYDLLSFLDEEGIDDIAERAVRAYMQRSAADTELPVLKEELEEIQTKIRNLIKLAESGILSDDLSTRLSDLEDGSARFRPGSTALRISLRIFPRSRSSTGSRKTYLRRPPGLSTTSITRGDSSKIWYPPFISGTARTKASCLRSG